MAVQPAAFDLGKVWPAVQSVAWQSEAGQGVAGARPARRGKGRGRAERKLGEARHVGVGLGAAYQGRQGFGRARPVRTWLG